MSHHGRRDMPCTPPVVELGDRARTEFGCLTAVAQAHIAEARRSMNEAIAQGRAAVDSAVTAMHTLDNLAREEAGRERQLENTAQRSMQAAMRAVDEANQRAQSALSNAMLSVQRSVLHQPEEMASTVAAETAAVSAAEERVMAVVEHTSGSDRSGRTRDEAVIHPEADG